MLGLNDDERLFPDVNIGAGNSRFMAEGLGLGDASPQHPPINQTSAPSEALPSPADVPASGYKPYQATGMDKVVAFLAGMGGDPSLLARMEKKHADAHKMKVDEAGARMDIVKKISDVAKQIPEGTQREAFLEKASLQYESSFPGIGETIKAVKRPDILNSLPVSLKSDPMLQLHANAGSLEDFAKSPEGIKYLNGQITRVYSEEFGQKIGPVVEWVKKNKSDIYRRVMADEALTTSEIRELHNAVPENIKMSPELFSHALAPENQERLFGQLGLKVITDKTAQDMTDEEFTSKGDPEFEKLMKERGVIERKLDSVTDPKQRQRLERDLKDINDRINRDKTKDTTTRDVSTWNVIKDNAEKELKPVIEMQGHLKIARSALALATPEADIALQRALANIFDSGSRAEAEVQAWKNSGDVVTRLWQSAYRFGTGEITPERRQAIGELLDQIDNQAIKPGMRDTLKYYEDVATANKIDPYLITGRYRSRSGTSQPESNSQQAGQLPSPKTKADYDKLPSGSKYLHPDGTTKVKK